jgi:hypothetical protein
MKYLRTLLILAIAFAAVAPAKADTTVGTPILSFPFFITKTGKYRLTKPLLNLSSDPAITILARDVVIDLNGFSIIGQTANESDNIAIVVNGGNAIIRNGTIRKFQTAIADSVGASGTIVEDVICTGQTSTAIRLAAPDNVLRRVIVRNVGLQDDDPDEIFGFRLTGSAVIENCLIQNMPIRQGVTTNVAIRLSGGSYVVKDTDIHRAGGVGISTNADISSIFERVRIRECGTGLSIAGTQAPPLLRECTIRDSVVDAVSGSFDEGGRNNIN